jgi:predicted ribosomally synthesized peptide with SipW-like signal peptide
MNKKRAIATITACGLVAAMALGGSLAYLTDNESHTNTVQVSGNVRVDLVEPNWDETDGDGNGIPDKSQETVPNQEVLKDPKVINTGENPAIVFLRLTVPVKDVTRVLDDGTLVQKNKNVEKNAQGMYHEPQDIFFFKQANDATGLHANHWNAKWKRLPAEEYNTELDVDEVTYQPQKVGQAVYVFGWEDVLAPNGTATDTLFDKIQIRNIIENEIASDQVQNIKLETFAIQADNLLLKSIQSDGSHGQGTLFTQKEGISVEDLTEIYDIFVQQNGHVDETKITGDTDNRGDMVWDTWQDQEHGQTAKEAEISNERNLNDTGARVATTFKNNSVKATKTDLKVGDVGNMTYTLSSTRSGANVAPQYSSSNPEVVSINATNGQFTALKKGDATLTVVVDGVKASVQVNVMNDSRDPVPDTTVDINDANYDPNGTNEPATTPKPTP